jgi:hypothetical protein
VVATLAAQLRGRQRAQLVVDERQEVAARARVAFTTALEQFREVARFRHVAALCPRAERVSKARVSRDGTRVPVRPARDISLHDPSTKASPMSAPERALRAANGLPRHRWRPLESAHDSADLAAARHAIPLKRSAHEFRARHA